MVKTLIQLFVAFAKIGFTSFGGTSMIPLIMDEMLSHGWMNEGDVTNIVAIAEMTPGPITVNSATFVGIRMAGIPGALVATIGCIFPSLIIVSLISWLYERYRSMDAMQAVLACLRPAVVALIIGPVLTLSRGMHWTMLVVIAASALAIWWLDWSPIWILAAAAALGIAWELTMAKKVKGER